jgi:hypothetical protein
MQGYSNTTDEQTAMEEFESVPSYFERFKTDEEYEVVPLINGVPVIFYAEGDDRIHDGINPCGKAGCPCMG